MVLGGEMMRVIMRSLDHAAWLDDDICEVLLFLRFYIAFEN